LPAGFYKEVVKLLSEAGYEYETNAKGDHEKWCDEKGRTLIVPRNMKSRHTANGILKDAGLGKKF
jgi:predicted RNA binding protein YcfA (HicA-like mRNA interferase family)